MQETHRGASRRPLLHAEAHHLRHFLVRHKGLSEPSIISSRDRGSLFRQVLFSGGSCSLTWPSPVVLAFGDVLHQSMGSSANHFINLWRPLQHFPDIAMVLFPHLLGTSTNHFFINLWRPLQHFPDIAMVLFPHLLESQFPQLIVMGCFHIDHSQRMSAISNAL